jgi:hypothetical protein
MEVDYRVIDGAVNLTSLVTLVSGEGLKWSRPILCPHRLRGGVRFGDCLQSGVGRSIFGKRFKEGALNPFFLSDFSTFFLELVDIRTSFHRDFYFYEI